MKWEKNQLSALGRMILRQCHVDWRKMKRVQTIKPNLPPLWSPLAYLLFFFRFDSDDVFWKEYRQLSQLRKAPETHYYIMTISAKGKKGRELAIPDYQLRKHQNFIREQILARIALPVQLLGASLAR